MASLSFSLNKVRFDLRFFIEAFLMTLQASEIIGLLKYCRQLIEFLIQGAVIVSDEQRLKYRV